MQAQRASSGELVVDTSVVVKFFVTEPDSHNADTLLESFREGAVRLIAVDFLFPEFANALWQKTRRGELPALEAEGKVADLRSWPLEIIPVRAILLEAFRLACYYGHAVYDSAFLALAESRGIPLITADRSFYHKIRRRSPNAVLLRDWSPNA